MLNLGEGTASASAAVQQVQRQLAHDTFALVRAPAMWNMLAELGAKAEDVPSLSALWDDTEPQRDEHDEEVYPYKGTLASYWVLGEQADGAPAASFNATRVTRSSWPPGKVLELIDATTVHSVSFHRVHKAWPHAVEANSVVRALHKFVYEILARPSDIQWRNNNGTGDSSGGVAETFMSAFRVRKSMAPGRFQMGDPGPEGIHSDDCDLTVVTMMQRENLAHDSGGNRVWRPEQPCGKPTVADTVNATGRLRAAPILRERFDTLIILDREAKHEALPIAPADAEAKAERGQCCKHGAGSAASMARRDVLTMEVVRGVRQHVAVCEGGMPS